MNPKSSKILSLLLAVCMIFTMLPYHAFALDTQSVASSAEPPVGTSSVCSCTDKCAEGAANAECPVCGAEGADFTLCTGTESEPAKCTCTEKCTEGTANAECPVCGAEGADLTLCTGKAADTQPECTCPAGENGEIVHKEGCPLYVTPEVEISDAVQQLIDMIDALSNADAITKENQEQALADLQAVLAAYAALQEGESALTAAELDALLGEERLNKLAALQSVLAPPITYAVETQGTTPTFNVEEGAITIEDAPDTTKLKVSYGAGLSQTVNRTDAIILTGTAGSAETNGSTQNLITVKCTGSVNITLSDLTLYGLTPFSIQSSATVSLTLAGTNLLHSSAYGRGAGLYVPEGASLIIDGSGSLDAKGYYGGAGIGGGTSGSRDITTNSGSITIKGGTVKAEAFAGGAGIGSGIFITGSSAEIYGTCGNICIEGGTVTATSTTSTTGNFLNGIFIGRGGAGIGGCDEGNSGTIQISGGTVVATGAAYGAGIGGGFHGSGGVTTISGGTVTATGGTGAAGIGSGCDTQVDDGDSLTCGTITLSGGTINAKGGTGDTMSIGNSNKYTGALTSEGAIAITGSPTINTYGVAMTRPFPTGATAITASVTLNDGRIAKDSEEAYTVSIGQTKFAPVTAKATNYSVRVDVPVSYITLTGTQTLTITDTKGHSWTQQVTIADKVEVTFGEPLRKATLWFYDSSISANISPVTLSITQNGEQLNATDTAQLVTLVADNSITKENSGVGKLVLYLPESNAQTNITVTVAALNGGALMIKENQSITAATNNITMLDTGSTALTDTLDLAYGNITFTDGVDGKVQITYTPSEGASAITKGGLSWREHYRVVQTGAETATNNQLIVSNTGDNTALITLAGVNMTNTNGCIELAKAKAELTLEGANKLVSAANTNNAALHVAEDSSVWIDGAGSLDATTYSDGAAIGGNYHRKGGAITIRGGTINANGTFYTGGILKATSTSTRGAAGAAIGGSHYNSCGNITITGGTVRASSTSDAPAIGGGTNGKGGTTTVTSGSVYVSNAKKSLTNQSVFTTDGTTPAYQTLVDLTTVYGSNAAVTTPVLGSYGFHDVFTDDVGTVYLYLPVKNGTTATFDGIQYAGDVQAKNGNRLVRNITLTLGEADSITTSSAVVSVTADADATVYYAALNSTPTTAAELENAAGTGNIAVTKDVQRNVALSGLTTGTTYTYYFAAKLSDGTYSPVKSVTFTTLKPALTGTATASGTYGQALSALTLTGGTVTDSDGKTVTGTWAFAQDDAENVYPTVDGITAYTTTFTPASGSYSNTLTAEVIPTMAYLSTEQAALSSPTPNAAGWNNSVIILTAPNSCTISAAATLPGNWGPTIGQTTEGEGTLTYYLKDNTSGLVAEKTFAYMLDQTAPEIGNLTYDSTQTFWDWIFGKDTIQVTVPVTDALSGADHITYALAPEGGSAAEPVSVAVSAGKATFDVSKEFKGDISILAYDKAENASAAVTTSKMAVEGTAPTLSAKDAAADGKDFTTSWYTTAQTVYITAQDTSSGLKSVSYTVDGDTKENILFTAKEADGKLTTTAQTYNFSAQEGEHTYHITATDNALNSTTVNVTIKQDSEAPAKPTLAITTDATDTTVTLKAEAADAISGVASYTLSGNGTTETSNTGVFALTGLTPGTAYTFTATATDKLGHESEASAACAVTMQKAAQAALTITDKPTEPITYGSSFTLKAEGGTGTGTVRWAVTSGDTFASVDNTGKVSITGVGEVTITATKAGDTSYKDATATSTFTTVKKVLTPAITGTTTKVYDGTTNVLPSQNFAITLDGVLDTDKNAVTATAKAYAYNSADVKNANKITATGIALSGDKSGCYELGSTTAEIEGSITISQPTIAFNEYVPGRAYNGTALKNPTAEQMTIAGAAYQDVTFTWYKGSVAEENKLSGAPAAAGSYLVVASIKATNNTAAASVTSAAITISPAALTITAKAQTIAYGESIATDLTQVDADALAAGDTLTGITLTASGTDVTTSGTITPSAAVISGGAKNYDITYKTGKLVITPVNPKYTVPTGLTATYGETLADVTLPAATNGKWSWNDSSSKVGNVGTNTFTATFTPDDSKNYNTISNISVKVQVAQADPTIGAVTYTGGTLYDSMTAGEVTLTRASTTVPGTLKLDEGQTLSAGTKDYNWTFTPIDTTNYKTVTGKISLTVVADTLQSISIGETKPTKTVYTYGEAFDTTGLTVTATYAHRADKDVTANVTFGSLSGGDTTITLSYTEDSVTKTCTVNGLTVNKQKLDVSGMSWSEGAYTYDGKEHGLTLNGTLPAGVEVAKTGDSATNAGDYTASASFTLAEGCETGNYEIIGTNPLEKGWSIAQAPITIAAKSQTIAYGESIATGIAQVDCNGLANKETLTKITLAASGTDATETGTITPSAAVISGGAENYAITYKTGKLVIIPVNPKYTVPTGLTAIYGETLADVTLPVAENGKWSWNDSSTTAVGNVGKNAFTATFTPNSTNYNTISNISVEVKVAQADPAIGTVTYTGGTLYDSMTADKVNLTRASTAVPGTLKLDEGQTLSAGTKDYSWTFTPTDTTNYKTVTGKISLTVVADTLQSISIGETKPTKTVYTYGEDFDLTGLTVTATYAGGKTVTVTDEVTASALKTRDTTVTLTYSDGKTTKTCTVSGLTVNKQKLDVSGMSWSEGAYTYNGKEYSVTLNGTLPAGVIVAKTGGSATNAGDYTASASFTLAEGCDAGNYAIIGTNPLTKNWSIAPGNRTVAAPTVSTSTPNSITLNAAVVSAGSKEGRVEYGYADQNDVAKVKNWQSAAAFTQLSANTDYYFFARITGGENYMDATSTFARITTPDYQIVAGADQTVTVNAADDLVFRSNAPHAKFVKVQVDKADLDAAKYTTAEGSTIVTLNAAYVNTLAVGNHILTIVSSDGSASTTFTVKAKGSSDNGGSAATYYTITTSAGAGGGFSTAETVSVRAGESAGFTITPNKGYAIADVKVDGKSVGAVSSYVFTNVTANHTISAAFTKIGHANPQTGVEIDVTDVAAKN